MARERRTAGVFERALKAPQRREKWPLRAPATAWKGHKRIPLRSGKAAEKVGTEARGRNRRNRHFLPCSGGPKYGGLQTQSMTSLVALGGPAKAGGRAVAERPVVDGSPSIAPFHEFGGARVVGA